MILRFGSEATYEIRIQGDLDQSWSDKLRGLQILINRDNLEYPVTTLIGKMSDQAALKGIMQTLWDLHFPLISIKLLDVDEPFASNSPIKY